MLHTTIGLDIGRRAVRCAICNIDGQKISMSHCLRVAVGEQGVNEALSSLSERVAALKLSVDAVGATVDPTLMLSAHRSLPFNEPHAVEQILPQSLGDIWTIDENSQIAFEVGRFVEQKAEDGENAGSSEPVGGYDVYAIHYPRVPLAEQIDQFKSAHLDPHVMIPSSEALKYALGGVIEPPQDCWCLLDIGEDYSVLWVVNGAEILLSRAFKVGSSAIDDALVEAYGISRDEARNMKERTGFVAVPGAEVSQYKLFVMNNVVEQWDIDPAAMSQACLRGLGMLFSSFRQTLINFATKNRMEPVAIYLVGNGANLPGLDEYLAQFSGVSCSRNIPLSLRFRQSFDGAVAQNAVDIVPLDTSFPLDAVCAAVAADQNIDGKYALNLRRGALAHKGSLAFIQENKWLFAALFVGVLVALIFMMVTKANMIRSEHDRVKQALEKASMEVFDKKLLSKAQVEAEISQSKGFDFIPEKTAFTHFAWLSSQVNDNLSDVEMDINSLDIDNQRKIVTIRGDVSGDDGLPKFMQLLETYECFPKEIQEPKTSKSKDRTSFTLRIESHHCGGESE